MTPDFLERVILVKYPRRGKSKLVNAFKLEIGAYKKFANDLGISTGMLRAYRTGRKPIPKWMNMAVQGMCLPNVPYTGFAPTMFEEDREDLGLDTEPNTDNVTSEDLAFAADFLGYGSSLIPKVKK